MFEVLELHQALNQVELPMAIMVLVLQYHPDRLHPKLPIPIRSLILRGLTDDEVITEFNRACVNDSTGYLKLIAQNTQTLNLHPERCFIGLRVATEVGQLRVVQCLLEEVKIPFSSMVTSKSVPDLIEYVTTKSSKPTKTAEVLDYLIRHQNLLVGLDIKTVDQLMSLALKVQSVPNLMTIVTRYDLGAGKLHYIHEVIAEHWLLGFKTLVTYWRMEPLMPEFVIYAFTHNLAMFKSMLLGIRLTSEMESRLLELDPSVGGMFKAQRIKQSKFGFLHLRK